MARSLRPRHALVVVVAALLTAAACSAPSPPAERHRLGHRQLLSAHALADLRLDLLEVHVGDAPDMAVNIEHEDADYGRLEGLALAAENLRAAAAKV